MPAEARPRAYSAKAASTPLLSASGIRADWIDRQRQPVSPNACTDPAEWADGLFERPPRWIASVLALRDRAVALVGLSRPSREGFRILECTEQEVLVGSDDRHLDFRSSIRVTQDTVDVVTRVEVHNVFGRLYLVPVRLVHPVMVRRMLRHAAATLDRL